ncbi:Dihydrolipoyllysine-residue acetyltransferase component of pyruvate dehydrogenase complex [Candidatus Kinetoplastibacterium sorsogonicusi]|uniref:Dihydrolipoamide acetyltransferase component of pyruvate dehydrogenase complex n=1 Tax=Candidatus Kinetoplastidibacterium kentomonadis TaxID=1576550 RepID=A0A3Q8ER99_9PROT|nr:2-oxo acid dehydrogenase subunit E2 [Candidatus Kinetoplastibacterium sorsogonicusi]AWD32405.1 Dihydrolipoyllysine-residue acetyltransferase component of pyruvate dehydrogenase complex [Candidatus Kinetoplastibacterium sorsogonicusi]
MSEILEIKISGMEKNNTFKVIEILVNINDTISNGQSLITLESEKASVEIPSNADGIVKDILVNVGDNVKDGTTIIKLEKIIDQNKTNKHYFNSNVMQENVDINIEKEHNVDKKIDNYFDENINKFELTNDLKNIVSHASPSVRKFARELGVDISLVKGTSPKNRINFDDVKLFVKKSLQKNSHDISGDLNYISTIPWPNIDFKQFGEIEYQNLSRIKKIAKSNLHRNWLLIPHVTNHDEADISNLEKLRISLNEEYKKKNIKITMLSFIMKAVAKVLKEIPEFNSSLENDRLILKKYYNIGFAVDTPNGLLVPVVKNVDKKDIIDITLEINQLSMKARENKLMSDDMSGGCFSISSLGGIGGSFFTPIINAPEVAILGISKNYYKPVWNGTDFIPKLILPISLSYDHRVIDGAAAARFNVYLCKLLAEFSRVIL